MSWFYVYYFKDNCYIFERTCGTRKGAEDRVQELAGRGITAVWLQNHLIAGAYY